MINKLISSEIIKDRENFTSVSENEKKRRERGGREGEGEEERKRGREKEREEKRNLYPFIFSRKSPFFFHFCLNISS